MIINILVAMFFLHSKYVFDLHKLSLMGTSVTEIGESDKMNRPAQSETAKNDN